MRHPVYHLYATLVNLWTNDPVVYIPLVHIYTTTLYAAKEKPVLVSQTVV